MATREVTPTSASRGMAVLLVLITVFLMVAGIVIRIVPPIVQTGEQIVSQAVVVGLQAVVAAARVPYEAACASVLASGEVHALVGDPVRCAPMEDVEWMGQTTGELEFAFTVAGPNASVEAHANAVATETSFELVRLEVTGANGEIIVLPPK